MTSSGNNTRQSSARPPHIDDVISVVQGCPKERLQILRQLFHQPYRIFYPNEEAETDRKYPISLKKLGQVDGEWSNQKTVLGWNLYTIDHLLCLLPRRKDKVEAALTAIPRTAYTMSL